MTTAPLVSVVIPSRDRNAEVQRAVASALQQTLSDLEVIVVDDGSVEPARDALSPVVTDPRLRFHRNDAPTGPSAARNVGTELARGTFVAYLDSDDEWHRTKLHRQIDALQPLGGAAGLCICGYEVVSGTRRRARVPIPVAAGDMVELLDTRHEPIVSSCFVLPTAMAQTYRFDADLGAYEDLDFAARIATTHAIVTTRAILVRKHVSVERQFSGPRILDARRTLLAKHSSVLHDHPAVLARNELTMAAELARRGDAGGARDVLESIDPRHLSPWIRMATRVPPGSPKRFATVLDAVRRVERFSVRGAIWRVRTSRLRWPA